MKKKEWSKLSISRNLKVGQSLSFTMTFLKVSVISAFRDFAKLLHAPQKELIPTAFTVRGKKVVFARLAYEERTLPWREN